MELSKAMQGFILHWGDMGPRWGLNRSAAQIHALLHLVPEAMSAEEICAHLGLARSNVSTGLKELQALGIVSTSRRLGDRKDYFTADQDVFDLARSIAEARFAREVAPTLAALEQLLEQAKQDDTPKPTRKRIKETLSVLQLGTKWYRDMIKLPQGVQLALLKLGGGVAALLPKDKSG